MKMKTLALASIAAFGLVSVAAQATTSTTVVNGGTVHFKGEIVSAACAVDAGSIDQTVQLGQIRAASLTSGKTSNPVPFNIQLDDCDPTLVTNGVSLIWSGSTVTGNTQALSVQSASGATAAATNVGIQILDPRNTLVTFDNSTATTATKLTSKTNVLNFKAQYIAVGGDATAGVANADASFKVQYQ
ncbi:type 1 fimbrial major subunit FimA [Rosenbergiella australiborealis]|uniref:Fimbrial protein n=1 Tax=Rosenbergiella australiborealis TaxID=1544696 RepID=A0ABS5T803_9GAMM|nr:type 1 fimbrial major subunit FimA [Rosenbergiella australiborealis]MBT0728466.1 fimbrial protein [Rosenbergiella australiborealis]